MKVNVINYLYLVIWWLIFMNYNFKKLLIFEVKKNNKKFYNNVIL